MISLLQRLVTEICQALCHISEPVTAPWISIWLRRLGELQSIMNLCLNYIFVTQEATDLNYQLNFALRHVEEAVFLLEKNLIKNRTFYVQ